MFRYIIAGIVFFQSVCVFGDEPKYESRWCSVSFPAGWSEDRSEELQNIQQAIPGFRAWIYQNKQKRLPLALVGVFERKTGTDRREEKRQEIVSQITQTLLGESQEKPVTALYPEQIFSFEDTTIHHVAFSSRNFGFNPLCLLIYCIDDHHDERNHRTCFIVFVMEGQYIPLLRNDIEAVIKSFHDKKAPDLASAKTAN